MTKRAGGTSCALMSASVAVALLAEAIGPVPTIVRAHLQHRRTKTAAQAPARSIRRRHGPVQSRLMVATHHILRPGGRENKQEFSQPTNRLLRGLYNWPVIVTCGCVWGGMDGAGWRRCMQRR